MAGYLSKREVERLADELEKQGCKVKRTRMGFRFMFPNGDSAQAHFTVSDIRGLKNLKSEILRAGLDWPFGHGRRASTKPKP